MTARPLSNVTSRAATAGRSATWWSTAPTSARSEYAAAWLGTSSDASASRAKAIASAMRLHGPRRDWQAAVCGAIRGWSRFGAGGRTRNRRALRGHLLADMTQSGADQAEVLANPLQVQCWRDA